MGHFSFTPDRELDEPNYNDEPNEKELIEAQLLIEEEKHDKAYEIREAAYRKLAIVNDFPYMTWVHQAERVCERLTKYIDNKSDLIDELREKLK